MTVRRLVVVGLAAALVAIPAGVLAQDRVGVGVNVGTIDVDEPLLTGDVYRLPTVGVINTGEVTREYTVRVTHRADQQERRPPEEWFRFDPDRFTLEPGEVRNVTIRVAVPRGAELGEYFAFLEASPAPEGEGATVGVAAATKLSFAVDEGARTILGVIWNWFNRHAPTTYWVTGGLLLAGLLYVLWRRYPIRIRLERP